MMLHSFLQLIRAPNGITAISNIVAASFIASSGQPAISDTLLLCLASLCFYYAGMTLNDYLDFAEDSQERPGRPLPSGKISLSQARLIIAIFTLVGLTCAYFVSLTSLFVAISLCIAIVTYNGFFKEGIGGACAMASCRYLNWLLGLSIASLSWISCLLPLPIFLYIIALTYLSKQETRAENPLIVKSVAALLALALLTLPGLESILNGNFWISLALISLFAVSISYKLAKTIREFTPANIQGTVVWLIIGIIPLDALMLMIDGHYLIGILLILLIFPCRYLSKKLAMT
ncbi:MAG: UbiA family prenyltransferase [Acidiferrobacterales bacterium]|nr:UbiA family prenyltransferase [Acidiferrobacterales bacterium]